MAQKKSSKSPATKPAMADAVEKESKKPQNLSEALAEDLCEVISEGKAELKKDKEEIVSDKKFGLKGIILVVAIGILLYWGLNHLSTLSSALSSIIGLLSPFIGGFIVAFIINTVLVPVENLWQKIFSKAKKKGEKVARALKRPVCLILSSLIVIGVISAILFIIIPELKDTIKAFIDKLPAFLTRLEGWFGSLSEFLANYEIELPELTLNADKIIDVMNSFITEKGQTVLDKTMNITTSIFGAVFNAILAFVFAFYLLAKKEKVGRKTTNILYATLHKKSADRIIRVATLTNTTFTKFVTGQLTEAVIIGLLCFIGMSIFRMPYAPIISVLIGATALIPIFGAFIGTAIGAVLILSVDFLTSIWFVVFVIVLQQIETNIIYPKVVGKSVGLPGILVLAAVTIGGGLFGFAGILFGVPVCSVIYSIFNEFVTKRLEDRSISSCKNL